MFSGYITLFKGSSFNGEDKWGEFKGESVWEFGRKMNVCECMF